MTVSRKERSQSRAHTSTGKHWEQWQGQQDTGRTHRAVTALKAVREQIPTGKAKSMVTFSPAVTALSRAQLVAEALRDRKYPQGDGDGEQEGEVSHGQGRTQMVMGFLRLQKPRSQSTAPFPTIPHRHSSSSVTGTLLQCLWSHWVQLEWFSSFQLPLDAFPPGWLQQAGLVPSVAGDNVLLVTPLLLLLPLTQLQG